MHGDPGSGKSTLAREIGRRLPAIVIDKDTISSALLRSGVDRALVGPASYEAMRALAAELLEAGHSVVLDSPCGWPSIEENGRALAARFGVAWAMIETVCPDDELDRRLAVRSRLESQPVRREDWYARPGSARPGCERLTLDSMRPADEMADAAVAYLRRCGALQEASA